MTRGLPSCVLLRPQGYGRGGQRVWGCCNVADASNVCYTVHRCVLQLLSVATSTEESVRPFLLIYPCRCWKGRLAGRGLSACASEVDGIGTGRSVVLVVPDQGTERL